jgi:hypothetical protein
MTAPQTQAGGVLPGGLMVDWTATAVRRNASQALQSVDMANAASLGAILMASGVDPVVTTAVVSDVQQVINNAVMASVHIVASAIGRAQEQRSMALKTALDATPRIDVLGARHAIAAVLGDPSIAVSRDPTPSMLHGRYPDPNGGPQQ